MMSIEIEIFAKTYLSAVDVVLPLDNQASPSYVGDYQVRKKDMSTHESEMAQCGGENSRQWYCKEVNDITT